MLLPAIALGAALQAAATEPATIGETAVSEKIDSILQNTDKLDGMVRRSIVNGGSKPVSFAGEADAKFVASSHLVAPQWMLGDKTEFKNSNVTLRMAMVAKPHRNLTLWSKLAFNNALLGYPTAAKNASMGNMTDDDSGQAAYTVGNDVGDKRGAILYEDMCVGMIMSAGPVSFNFKAGGVLWNEMSPLTVWKTQPRMFGWDYLPYELEQSTAMFYDYATVKGFKEGRAAWNKKPFQGLQLESIDLPWNLYLNTLYGFYEGYNKNNPWQIPIDKTNELQYTDSKATEVPGTPWAGGVPRTSATKGFGISDNYRPVWFLRLAKGELPGGVTVGLNWFQYIMDKDYPKQWSNRNGYSLTVDDAKVIMTTALTDSKVDSGLRYINNYYIEPRVASMDFRRNIPGGLSFHIDVGASYVDTAWFKTGPAQNGSSSTSRFKQYTRNELDTIVVGTRKTAPNREDTAIFQREMVKYRPEFREAAATANPWDEIGRTNSGWKPAVYASISYPFPWFELEVRSMYADKEFHSGASTIGPINGIFPYESNLTGPGKFAGVDNGTSYSSNLTGSNLIVKIPVPRGHARVSLGLHSQIEKGDDIVYFPWRQNGASFNATMHSDYTRYGLGLLDDYLRTGPSTVASSRMIRRLGDEMYFRPTMRNPYAPTPGYGGGMRADYMAVYEGYAAYKLTESWKHPYVTFAGRDSSMYVRAIGPRPTDAALLPKWSADSISALAQFKSDSVNFLVDSTKWMAENGEVYRQILANQDSGQFRAQHKKATQNFSVDLSYEISRLWEGKRSLFLAGYAAFNSVTNGPGSGIPAFKPGKDVLLVGRNLRFEPVFQLTPRFYIIGLVSQETWQSDYGVAMIDTTGMAPGEDDDWLISEGGLKNLRRAPIDYTDWIYGLGFDWDIAPRVSFHVRGQYFTHEDAGISVDLPSAAGRNDYRAWLGSTEMKMWF